jgi:hypothetical protein
MESFEALKSKTEAMQLESRMQAIALGVAEVMSERLGIPEQLIDLRGVSLLPRGQVTYEAVTTYYVVCTDLTPFAKPHFHDRFVRPEGVCTVRFVQNAYCKLSALGEHDRAVRNNQGLFSPLVLLGTKSESWF